MTDSSVQIFAVALAATWCGFGLYGLARMAARSPQGREMLERLRRRGPLAQGAALALLVAVAGFHTHMPICYDPNPSAWRNVGPSTGIPGDHATAQSIHIPGLLWDYEPNELSTGHLTRNHSINGPSRLYPVIPPARRETPQ